MFPMRMATVFKSRWWACVWCAGILWTAYDFASAQPQAKTDGNNTAEAVMTDGTGAPVTNEDAENLNKALDQF